MCYLGEGMVYADPERLATGLSTHTDAAKASLCGDGGLHSVQPCSCSKAILPSPACPGQVLAWECRQKPKPSVKFPF